MKDSFVFYRSFYDSIKNLDKDTQLEVYNALFEYSLNEVEPTDLSPVATAIFTLIKPNVDNATKRYNACVENGKKGGRPKKEKNLEKPNENLKKPNHNLKKPSNNLEEPNDNLEEPSDILGYEIDESQEERENKLIEGEYATLTNQYPKRVGLEAGKVIYFDLRKNGESFEEIEQGIQKYNQYIKNFGIEQKYIKNFPNFLKEKAWLDTYDQTNTYNVFDDILYK